MNAQHMVNLIYPSPGPVFWGPKGPNIAALVAFAND